MVFLVHLSKPITPDHLLEINTTTLFFRFPSDLNTSLNFYIMPLCLDDHMEEHVAHSSSQENLDHQYWRPSVAAETTREGSDYRQQRMYDMTQDRPSQKRYKLII